MSHQFSYPKVTEIRRVSLEVATPSVPLAPAMTQRGDVPRAGR